MAALIEQILNPTSSGDGGLQFNYNFSFDTNGLWLETPNQIMHFYIQGFRNFEKRIHGWRFFSSFDATDKNRRKIGFFSQFFLTQVGFFAFGANRFAQNVAVFLISRHDLLKKQESSQPAMSLTTIL